MKARDFLNPSSVYVEIGQGSLKVLDGDDGLDLSLERLENGRLTPACRERLASSLRLFLKRHKWRPKSRAFCAIGARGVSLRRVTLPGSSKEELDRVLALQIEREFPLSPDELAWGYRPLGRTSGNGAPGLQELLVVAVKKEVLQEYSEILSGCGLSPVFTLGALARSSLCSDASGSFAILDVGQSQSELISFENGIPSAIRIVPWGGENITQAVEKRLEISRAQAEEIKSHLENDGASNPDLEQKLDPVIGAELNSLAGFMQRGALGQKLFITGDGSRLNQIGPRLGKAIGGSVDCEPVRTSRAEGRSAAILGLKKICEQNGSTPPLLLGLNGSNETERLGGRTSLGGRASSRNPTLKWAALAVGLLFCSFALRYAEPLIQKPRLAKRIAAIKAYRDELPNIDRELGFLQYLKTNQPAYIDPVFALADAAPPGTRLESLTINRRGDLSLRATMRDSLQVVQFRSKLIESGFFSSVVVEEQTPGQQKTTVRMIGQWKSSTEIPATRRLVPVRKDSQQPPNLDSVAQTVSAPIPGTASVNDFQAPSSGDSGVGIAQPPNTSETPSQSSGSRRTRVRVSPPTQEPKE